MKVNITSYLIVIMFHFSLVSCSWLDNYTINEGLNPDEIINFESISPISSPADSSSKILVRETIYSNSDSAHFVSLSTTSGVINGKSKNEKMQVNLERYADFILTTGQVPGPVLLHTSVLGQYSADTVIYYSISYPDTILIIPNSYSIDKNTVLNLNINLVKNMGYASKGLTLILSAQDSVGNELGNFITTQTYSPGAPVVATFTGTNDFTGHVTLKAFIKEEEEIMAQGMTTILLK